MVEASLILPCNEDLLTRHQATAHAVCAEMGREARPDVGQRDPVSFADELRSQVREVKGFLMRSACGC